MNVGERERESRWKLSIAQANSLPQEHPRVSASLNVNGLWHFLFILHLFIFFSFHQNVKHIVASRSSLSLCSFFASLLKGFLFSFRRRNLSLFYVSITHSLTHSLTCVCTHAPTHALSHSWADRPSLCCCVSYLFSSFSGVHILVFFLM